MFGSPPSLRIVTAATALSPFQGDEERSDGGGGCGLSAASKALIPLRFARVLLPEREECLAHLPRCAHEDEE